MSYAKTYKATFLEDISQFPRVWNYGQYRSNNYGEHTVAVSVGGVDFFYSYKTLVAFSDDKTLVVHSNNWTRTTGKHLTWIKRARPAGMPCITADHPTFVAMLYNLLRATGLVARNYAKKVPCRVQALETGEIIDGNIPSAVTLTPGRAYVRDQERKMAKAKEKEEEKARKLRLKLRKERRLEKKRREEMFSGLMPLEIVEEML